MKKTFLALIFAIILAVGIQAQPPAVGGYRQIDINDADAQAAAHFAVDAHNASGSDLKLIAVQNAQRQIVAGRNYSLCMQLLGPQDAKSYARAVVYQNLQQKMSLTSWKAVDNCAQSEGKMQEPNTVATMQEPNTKSQEPNTAGKPQEPNTKTDDARPPTPQGPQEPIAGGYAKADINSAEVKAAAKFAIAVKKRSDPTLKLLTIDKAWQQVVAGMNYSICMSVHGKGDAKGATHLVHAVVFLNLKQKMELTSYFPVSECKDE